MTTLVLVHGAFHGPWCFAPLVAELTARGVSTIAPELPLTSLADDAAAVAQALDAHGASDGTLALLGHSYGGAVITAAGSHRSVGHLIYLAAMGPDDGESVSGGPIEIGERFLAALRPSADGRLEVASEQAAELFYPDADQEIATRMAAMIRPGNTGLRGERIGRAAWHDRRTDYIVCTDDPIVLPSGQRAIATRMGCPIHDIGGDHSPFLARPGELAELLMGIIAG